MDLFLRINIVITTYYKKYNRYKESIYKYNFNYIKITYFFL